ncbi:MAG: methionyl-tRNA formyltransferase [Magnetococcales bacterium]|nr:methionyl-tRNA formyltransferase [Magnetococcales bacterium]
MNPWRIVFMGTPDFSVPALNALLATDDPVVAVYTQPDSRSGRGMALKASPVKSTAVAEGIPVLQPARMRDDGVVEELIALKPDLIVVVAFGQILPKEVLDIPPQGCVNIHASLLPRWRGAAPIQRALMAGDEKTGITTMNMDVGLDTGDMLLTRDLDITPEMSGGQVHDALATIGAELIVETVAGLKSGVIQPVPQPEEGVTYAKKLNRLDGRIVWDQAPEVILRQIRALNPWPSAFTGFSGRDLKVHAARLGEGNGVPGRVVSLLPDGPEIACGSGSVVLTEVQMAGKKRMSAADWLRGAGWGLTPGARLG